MHITVSSYYPTVSAGATEEKAQLFDRCNDI